MTIERLPRFTSWDGWDKTRGRKKMESMSKAHFISVAELLTQLQTEGFSYGKKQLRIDHLILFNVSLLLRFFHFFFTFFEYK